MNMDLDLGSRRAAPFALQAGNHPDEPFDWYDLRARMAAAYAARSALELEKPCESLIGRGSFDRGSARFLAVYGSGPGEGLGCINRTALANGNSGCDNSAAAASTDSVGD
jgi:hypothetical protein